MSDSVNVLMVDDELVVLDAFVDILEDEGYTMFTADSGEKAVKILRANPIDIVVSDIKMPGMDGLELLSTIREHDEEIPVIMATAYSSIESTVESMKRGASNYLIKPIKVELLRSVLAEAAHKRRTLRANREFSETLRQLNAERERVLEVLGQDLRRPLIDQMNWCELLMSDPEHNLDCEHVEHVARINSAANGMLEHVNELLDEEKIRERARSALEAGKDIEGSGDEPASSEGEPETCGGEDSGTDQKGQDAIVAGDKTTPAPEQATPAGLDITPALADRLDFKVLVVEPCSVLRDLLVSVLKRKFRVFSAADGWEALKLMVDRPQLIVTELNLPSVDAPEMLRHARRIDQDFAVLAMYEKNDGDLLATARQSGVNDVLLKPFHITDLAARVDAWADGNGANVSASVLVVCSDPTDGHALYHLFDSRYPTRITASVDAIRNMPDDPLDVLVIDTDSDVYAWGEVVKICRARNKRLKVLTLSRGHDIQIADTMKEVGVNAALLKPYSVAELLLQVRRLRGISEIDGGIFRSVYRKLAI